MPVILLMLGFQKQPVRVVARRGVEAPSRHYLGVTPERLPRSDLGRQNAMATVTLTARYLNHLKSHGKRSSLFDDLVDDLFTSDDPWF